MKGFTERRPVRTQHLPVWGKQGAFRIAPHTLHRERRLSEEGGDGYGQCSRHGRQKDEPVVAGPWMASWASGAGWATAPLPAGPSGPWGTPPGGSSPVRQLHQRLLRGFGSASWRFGACWRRNGP